MKVDVIQVSYCRGSTLIPMGRLAYKERKIFFEYDPNFLELGLELSPFKLPLKPGVIACDDFVFEGLFGVFNDSLPDGWGRLLLDRKLMKMGINPQLTTPLDRLGFVGTRGMGALQYRPETENPLHIKDIKDLDQIAAECFEVLEHDEDEFVDELFALNGSSAGARPKVMLRLLPSEQDFASIDNNPAKAHNDWLIKFRSSGDPKDVGSIEYAYHLMAEKAGLDVPQAKLFQSKKCSGYFGVKRFDRLTHKFLHMHTVSGLLHADHRLPSLDYETIMKATWWLTKDIRECEKQFRQAAFNVFARNRDDHAKNFSFLMDENGVWSVSPAYDLIFSSGPGGEHATTVMREGKNPGVPHLLKLASLVSIKEERAIEIIDQVKQAISEWSRFAKLAHVSPTSAASIKLALLS